MRKELRQSKRQLQHTAQKMPRLSYQVASLLLLLLAGAMLPAIQCEHADLEFLSSKYTFSSTLSEKVGLGDDYKLFWSIDKQAETISFAVMVRTTGWVGFGLSPNGGMVNSDVVIGWVTNEGMTKFSDRYAEAMSMPSIDSSQDWELTHGEEENGYTILEFTRKWVTCDEKDRAIEANTARVIFSWHPEDPDDEQSVMYHGASRRGSASLNLLGGLTSPPKIPNDAQSFDILADNATIPPLDTTYWCQAVRLDERLFQEQNYILKYTPLISENSQQYVHHIVIYECPQLDESVVGAGGHCDGEISNSVGQCRLGTVLAVWAVGGEEFVYPEGVAIPIGGPGGFKFALLEMHYNNPTLDAGVVDNSGVRFTYSNDAPTYEAAALTVAHFVTPLMVIPPNAEEFVISAFCASECSEAFIPPEGIKVFASFLHTHVTGTGLELQHIRKKQLSTCELNEELPPVDKNLQYDFDYQQANHLPEVITLLPGDELILRCHYQTKDKDTVTLGGERTSDEMCVAFLLYYPRVDFSFCMSTADGTSLVSALPPSAREEVEQVFTNPTKYGGLKNGLENALNKVDWNQDQVERLQQAANDGTQALFCADDLSSDDTIEAYNQTIPIVDCPYVLPDACSDTQPTEDYTCTCSVSGATSITASATLLALLISYFLL